MATTTTEMQEIQNASRTAGNEVAAADAKSTSESIGSGTGRSLPNISEILAQPAVKKATPGIMIAILLVFLIASYLAMQDPVYRPIFPGMTDADRQTAAETLKEGARST